ncbi:MAG: hypothetical protein WHT84_10735 [Breznakiellaceae bacterium]
MGTVMRMGTLLFVARTFAKRRNSLVLPLVRHPQKSWTPGKA